MGYPIKRGYYFLSAESFYYLDKMKFLIKISVGALCYLLFVLDAFSYELLKNDEISINYKLSKNQNTFEMIEKGNVKHKYDLCWYSFDNQRQGEVLEGHLVSLPGSGSLITVSMMFYTKDFIDRKYFRVRIFKDQKMVFLGVLDLKSQKFVDVKRGDACPQNVFLNLKEGKLIPIAIVPSTRNNK